MKVDIKREKTFGTKNLCPESRIGTLRVHRTSCLSYHPLSFPPPSVLSTTAHYIISTTCSVCQSSSGAMNNPLICTWCNRGPFVRMETHLNSCKAAQRKIVEANEGFRELKRQGLPMTIELASKRPRFDLPEACSFLL